MIKREEVLDAKMRLCVTDKLSPEQREELAALNARITYEGETLCVDGTPWGQAPMKFFEFEDIGGDTFGCLAESEKQARDLIREQVEQGFFIEGYDPSDNPILRVHNKPTFIS